MLSPERIKEANALMLEWLTEEPVGPQVELSAKTKAFLEGFLHDEVEGLGCTIAEALEISPEAMEEMRCNPLLDTLVELIQDRGCGRRDIDDPT